MTAKPSLLNPLPLLTMAQTATPSRLSISSPRLSQSAASPRRTSHSGSLPGVPNFKANDSSKVVVSNKDIQSHAAVNCEWSLRHV